MIDQIRKVHAEIEIFQGNKDHLLNISENLLAYIVKILKNENPGRPEGSKEEWGKALSILASHRILPLIYWRSASLPKELHPPQGVIEKMRNIFMQSRVRSMQTERELKKISQAFKNARIRFLVLKGATFSKMIYPDPALRTSEDVDLLVHPDQVIAARDRLEELGYVCTEKRFEASRDFYCEEVFFPKKDSKNRLAIEIHWRLLYFSKINTDDQMEDIFNRAIKFEEVETLPLVDALLHQSQHLAVSHTQYLRLIWIYDIYLLANRLKAPDDWKTLQKRSVEWKARLALENCLKVASVWFGLKLPEGFNDFSNWPPPSEAEIKDWEIVLQKDENAFNYVKLVNFPAGFWPKVKVVLKVLFPHPSIMRIKYPKMRGSLLPLAYIIRWIKWGKPLFVRKKPN